MKRPSISDVNLIHDAINKHQEDFFISQGDSQSMEILVNIFQDNAPLFDGYSIAKQMEDKGWDPDEKMVHDIEDTVGTLEQLHQTAVRDWVIRNAIKPHLTIGQTVIVPKHGRDKHTSGEITQIYPDTATYVVYVAEKGHTKEGQGIKGWIVNFEELHELATPAENFVLSHPPGSIDKENKPKPRLGH